MTCRVGSRHHFASRYSSTSSGTHGFARLSMMFMLLRAEARGRSVRSRNEPFKSPIASAAVEHQVGDRFNQ